jgi:hypothetical protein
MPVIQVEARVSADQLLAAAEQMSPEEFSAFVARLIALRAQRETPRLSVSEADLLTRINQPIPHDLQLRYDALRMRRDEARLTPAEHIELVELSDRIEEWGANRIALLAELARIRHVGITELMNTLGIKPPEDAW